MITIFIAEAKSKPVTRGSVSSRSSVGSVHSMFDSSADETELHTIVYEKEFVSNMFYLEPSLRTRTKWPIASSRVARRH